MCLEGSDRVVQEAHLEEYIEIAEDFLQQAGHCPVWLFFGEMGSGKTTFIKALCNVLGVKDVMSSPTFSIVNEYLTKSNKRIFHFDFYRIKNEAEAIDIGTEEYLYSGNYCFVEWPEKIPSLVPLQHAEIFITVSKNNARTLSLSVHDGKEKNRI